MELYLANNNLINIKEIQNLSVLSKLIILDLSNNPFCKDPNYRIITLFHNKKLKVLDGLVVEASEHQQAKDLLTGRLTEEMLVTRVPNGQTTQEVVELNLSNCQLKDFENVFNSKNFGKLSELNLSQNLFQTTRMMGDLPTLKILTLSQNKIETLFYSQDIESKKGLNGVSNLEILDISWNQLKDLYGIQFCSLKRLKIFKVDHNEIIKLEHFENFLSIKELDLTANKLRQFDITSFPQLIPLKCLKINDNLLKQFNYLSKLHKLQHLFANNNRLNDFNEIERLLELPNLKELELKGNALGKKPGYRQIMIKKFSTLIYLDGKVVLLCVYSLNQFNKEIMYDEKEKIEQSLLQDQKQQLYVQPHVAVVKGGQAIQLQVQLIFQAPVKLNPLNFDGIFGGVRFPADISQTLSMPYKKQ